MSVGHPAGGEQRGIACATLSSPMASLFAALDAFRREHRLCRDLDGGVDRGRVWLACSCGAQTAHPTDGHLKALVRRGPRE